ncbi:endodeoxyribonuclease RusA [Marinobacter sp. JSM 1782161]|uniref:endodeoxyribonuclease RusA n=1 Tax=Marinobacter sp. JSM 1782161 TaxID=2685906 RepID=UPI0014025D5B|nr:endodeoxyribonuclease RusA [Marinobacter sp. JSM 1782161]
MNRNEPWTIDLPYPPRQLSPNARLHWAPKSRKAKQYRRQCWALTLNAIQDGDWNLFALRKLAAEGHLVHLMIDVFPPDRRGRDDDNIIASFKSGRDGIADALNIDDKHFRIHPVVHRESPVDGGRVTVGIALESR